MTFETRQAGPRGGLGIDRCRRALDKLDAVSRWVIIAAMAAMTILIVTQVFFRYMLSNSIDWAEESARITFVWAIFLAIPHGIRRGIHVGIDVVVNLLPSDWQDRLFRLSAILGIVLMAVVLVFAVRVTGDTWNTRLPTIDLTSAIYYIAVLIAAGHSILHLTLLGWGGSSTWQVESQT